MAKTVRVALILLFITAPTFAAPRRRAVQPPADTSSPASWLAANAHAFSTSESNGDVSDLASIGPLIGDATIVGLGDGTHGTHEYFATKRRIIEFLVRNKDFDEVDFEGEFLAFDAIDRYINGAPGDARQLVLSPTDIYYLFWEMQELVDLIEWMRDYNLHRAPGVRAIHIGGADIFGTPQNIAALEAYLDRVDPSEASKARTALACMSSPIPAQQCYADAAALRDEIASREAVYVTSSSQREFDDALHEAALVSKSTFGARDALMAENAIWLRDHHSATHKAVFWAHQEHVGRLSSIVNPTAGSQLTKQLGDGYFAFGNATFDGSFLRTDAGTPPPVSMPMMPLTSDGYEVSFHAARAPRLIIPLRGTLPPWLAETHHLRGGDAASAYDKVETLSKKFDAILYVETTTPNHWVR